MLSADASLAHTKVSRILSRDFPGGLRTPYEIAVSARQRAFLAATNPCATASRLVRLTGHRHPHVPSTPLIGQSRLHAPVNVDCRARDERRSIAVRLYSPCVYFLLNALFDIRQEQSRSPHHLGMSTLHPR
jgi:hypothetical protein